MQRQPAHEAAALDEAEHVLFLEDWQLVHLLTPEEPQRPLCGLVRTDGHEALAWCHHVTYRSVKPSFSRRAAHVFEADEP
jgi:hypothetical protein